MIKYSNPAVVLKLVDKHVSEACDASHGGSTPLDGTKKSPNYKKEIN